jgi:Glycosyl hydrolases family 39
MRPKVRRSTLLLYTLSFTLCSLILPYSGSPGFSAPALADGASRLYPETGHTLAPQFVAFYDKNGGVAQFGYPVSEARIESGYLVQWTERQRLEYHPENAGTQYEILLGLLGRELTGGLDGPRFRASVSADSTPSRSAKDEGESRGAGSEESSRFFKETGHLVEGLFLQYWQERGGLPIFGFPISNAYQEGSLEVQWFERARMEVHPENPPGMRVLLGHLGNEALKERNYLSYTLEVNGTAAPDTNMEIGLAQGGESEDPGFFDNIREAGASLGPGLVRLDNIFNYYGIVQRSPEGLISYDWSKLDRVLDGLRTMGKEALICLSYMPETMSVSGDGRVEPPAKYEEWANLVRATVAHVNVERKLGVRYWEVWNEPDQWGFWQAPYPEYLKLYDVTAEAALAADPTVKIGGPALSYFSTDHIGEFLEHERWNVAMGLGAHVDFISWHSYGYSPHELAANIRRVREILADFPQFNPQIFITEFNVLQGGHGDTSAGGRTDTVEGAIALLSSIESMQRERLDRALLFELKDGPGSTSYWGRWGILTYDGKPKPIYYALKAYQERPRTKDGGGMLPVKLKKGLADGSVGVMAYGSPQRATILLWYTGVVDGMVKVRLPSAFNDTEFDLTLFDAEHNNPAQSGDATLKSWMERNAGDLLVELKPNSLVIATSR